MNEEAQLLSEVERAMMRVVRQVVLMTPAERAQWEMNNTFRYANEFGVFIFVPAKIPDAG